MFEPPVAASFTTAVRSNGLPETGAVGDVATSDTTGARTSISVASKIAKVSFAPVWVSIARASTRCGPEAPRVQRSCTMPSAPVIAAPANTLPPPETTTKLTICPFTAWARESSTSATSGFGNSVPGGPLWLLPDTTDSEIGPTAWSVSTGATHEASTRSPASRAREERRITPPSKRRSSRTRNSVTITLNGGIRRRKSRKHERRRAPASRQPIRLLHQLIRQRPRHPPRVALVDDVARHQAAEIVGIDAPRQIVPRRDRAERARVVVEAGCLVDRRRFGRPLAEAPHAFHRIVEPPRGAEAHRGVVPRKRRELAAVRRFVQREQDEREPRIVAVTLEQRAQIARELRRHRNVAAHVGTEALEDLAVVVAQRAGMDLHDQTVGQRQTRHFHQ